VSRLMDSSPGGLVYITDSGIASGEAYHPGVELPLPTRASNAAT